MVRVLALLLVLTGIGLAAPAEAGSKVRVTTANIYVGLGPDAARADLRRAMRHGNVVLTQEMKNRRIDVSGWRRFTPGRRHCREVQTYWRRSVWRHVRHAAVVLVRGDAFPHQTRCANVVVLRHRATGRLVRFVNIHLHPHVELGGHPRACCPRKTRAYARAMDRLDRIVARPGRIVVGGDWNVGRRADCRVRWHGFPCAHLSGPLNTPPLRSSSPTRGNRHIDVNWYSPQFGLRQVRTIGHTRSDHQFSRVVLGW